MVVANALLAGLFLGVPWLRERARADEVRADFARFAACVYGGEAMAVPGLALPSGDTAHFAFRALRAGPDWPGRCRPILLAVAPEEARFLLPSAAAAEHEVRRAVDLVRRELDAFAIGRRAEARVATRPLRAIALLRAALAQMIVASGADRQLGRDAVRFTRGGALIEPTRVPLQAADDAPTYLEARGDGFVAFALDARGLGVVRLGAGQVDVHRIPRPRGVHAVVHGRSVSDGANAGPGQTIPWFVSLTPESRCVEDPFRCARRTMGIAPLERGTTAAPRPWLLAAHPWGGDVEAAVRVLRPAIAGGPVRLAVLARALDAGPELRVFSLDGEPNGVAAPPPPSASVTADAPSIEPKLPELNQPLEVGAVTMYDARLLADGRPVVVVPTDTGLQALLFDTNGVANRPLAEVEGTDGVLLRTCEVDGVAWVALGSTSHALVVHDGVDAPPSSSVTRVTLARGEALDGVRAVLSCDARGALLVAPVRSGGARILACDPDGTCHAGVLRELPRTAKVVASRDEGHGVVAYAVGHGAVRVLRIDARAAPLAASLIPAACWDDGTGLCGPPMLAARNGRILLVTREGADLRALETLDGGASWGPLRTLQ